MKRHGELEDEILRLAGRRTCAASAALTALANARLASCSSTAAGAVQDAEAGEWEGVDLGTLGR